MENKITDTYCYYLLLFIDPNCIILKEGNTKK